MKIEKGIPLPATRGRKRTVMASLLARSMEPGDSILCETRSEYETARHTLWGIKAQYTTRKEGEFWRVWRIS